jgi:hypothetical protein
MMLKGRDRSAIGQGLVRLGYASDNGKIVTQSTTPVPETHNWRKEQSLPDFLFVCIRIAPLVICIF